MPDCIGYADMTRMLRTAADRIRAAQETLAALDAAIGDGDHGAAMCKVADAITRTIEGRANRDLHALLSEMAWAAMGTDAGSTGPLYGSLFLGMSETSSGGSSLDARDFARMLEGGAANLRQNTKAKPGDKTMIDALMPAVEAIRAAADAGESVGAVLRAGKDAAARGAASTEPMQAAFGRARHLGARAIGHRDPGAASMSLLFAGFEEGFTDG